MVRNIFDFGYCILFTFMIIDDTGYLPLNPTKHTAEAKKHRSIRLGMVSYFNDIKTKSYIKHETNAKTIENTIKVP